MALHSRSCMCVHRSFQRRNPAITQVYFVHMIGITSCPVWIGLVAGARGKLVRTRKRSCAAQRILCFEWTADTKGGAALGSVLRSAGVPSHRYIVKAYCGVPNETREMVSPAKEMPGDLPEALRLREIASR
jgi:hypothetical protein